MQPHPLCHDKAHDYMGPHVHHMNDVHMVNQEEALALAAHDQPTHVVATLGCPNGICADMSPAVSRRMRIHFPKFGLSSYIPVVTACVPPTFSWQGPPSTVVSFSDTGPASISAPLRI
jgi:hypothetical protein